MCTFMKTISEVGVPGTVIILEFRLHVDVQIMYMHEYNLILFVYERVQHTHVLTAVFRMWINFRRLL